MTITGLYIKDLAGFSRGSKIFFHKYSDDCVNALSENKNLTLKALELIFNKNNSNTSILEFLDFNNIELLKNKSPKFEITVLFSESNDEPEFPEEFSLISSWMTNLYSPCEAKITIKGFLPCKYEPEYLNAANSVPTKETEEYRNLIRNKFLFHYQTKIYVGNPEEKIPDYNNSISKSNALLSNLLESISQKDWYILQNRITAENAIKQAHKLIPQASDSLIKTIIEADDYIDTEHNFKIEAGPGAGKSRFLINHIINTLQNSKRLSYGRKIACLTHTHQDALKITGELGDESDFLEVSTMQSFLFRHVVKPNLDLLKEKYHINTSKVDTPSEHIHSEGYFRKTGLEKYHGITRHEMHNDLIWTLSGENNILHFRHRPKKIYHSSLMPYKQHFWEQGIIHYEDILPFTWEIINISAKALKEVQYLFPYVFMDHGEEITDFQYLILKKISDTDTVIGIIGDEAQSIMSFQGANKKRFSDFELPGIRHYRIDGNYRCTEQIIDVLNMMRRDLRQNSPNHKSGNKPVIVSGDLYESLDYMKKKLNTRNVTTLSYSNFICNSVRNKIPLNKHSARWQNIEEIFQDSDHNRKRCIIAVMKAYELSKMHHYREAIREISKHFSTFLKVEDHERVALAFIKSILNSETNFKNKPIWNLYQIVINQYFNNINIFSISHITESKSIEKMSLVEHFYKENNYADLSLHLRIHESDHYHQTIHKSKGEGFENVFLIPRHSDKSVKMQDPNLDFLLHPDLENKEEHRVYYVACSRAEKNLWIWVPDISEQARKSLGELFDIVDLTQNQSTC